MDQDYLKLGVDPKSLKVAELKRILVEHDIDFPSKARKPLLIKLFNSKLGKYTTPTEDLLSSSPKATDLPIKKKKQKKRTRNVVATEEEEDENRNLHVKTEDANSSSPQLKSNKKKNITDREKSERKKRKKLKDIRERGNIPPTRSDVQIISSSETGKDAISNSESLNIPPASSNDCGDQSIKNEESHLPSSSYKQKLQEEKLSTAQLSQYVPKSGSFEGGPTDLEQYKNDSGKSIIENISPQNYLERNNEDKSVYLGSEISKRNTRFRRRLAPDLALVNISPEFANQLGNAFSKEDDDNGPVDLSISSHSSKTLASASTSFSIPSVSYHSDHDTKSLLFANNLSPPNQCASKSSVETCEAHNQSQKLEHIEKLEEIETIEPTDIGEAPDEHANATETGAKVEEELEELEGLKETKKYEKLENPEEPEEIEEFEEIKPNNIEPAANGQVLSSYLNEVNAKNNDEVEKNDLLKPIENDLLEIVNENNIQPGYVSSKSNETVTATSNSLKDKRHEKHKKKYKNNTLNSTRRRNRIAVFLRRNYNRTNLKLLLQFLPMTLYVLLKIFHFLLFAIPIVFALWYREERILVGYCGHESVQSILSLSIESPFFSCLDTILSPFKPKCLPCPANAICHSNLATECIPHYETSAFSSLLSLYGLIPLPPSCEPIETEKSKELNQITSELLSVLHHQNAHLECGNSADNGLSGMNEGELYNEFMSYRSPWINKEQYSELWVRVKAKLKNSKDIEWHYIHPYSNGSLPTNSTSNTEIVTQFRSHSKKYVRVTCSLPKIEILPKLEEALYSVAFLILLFITIKVAKNEWTRRLKEQSYIRNLIKIAIQELKVNKREQIESPFVNVLTIKSKLLNDISDADYKNYVWKEIKQKIEQNPNVLTYHTELQGEIMKCWEWVGQLAGDSD
ncbi:Heh2p NDAI_0H01880 [Naumovozyma dairenensis CBS 421]|uniref:LEM-like domain-containing protein n=1 Tax=Naumovozyma dairenensis (strain ATCC 10597 / BCRC 20456 / CBS 421 / NBRC 0211 / NRRL Y-12639) TaxID=1071378 RepID=G0WF01_NAUDC|nr:hypothetical protein NDAI_0H01880 [Naumovozyma dairenensis CBS 421]CCD26362.1 hypothetical protein NDAI_0H01880 [Naumovozyma dairenensis CBS 421]